MQTKKKVFLIWDLDGAIGQINSSLPYNFNYRTLEAELENVRYALGKLDEYQIKACFAVTGFSAEEGKYPYVFPELIHEISSRGHEIASHSWRHEWTPVFSRKQIRLSLERSKSALEKCTANGNSVVGFVPPHNRPMTWLRKGAFSLGDRGLYPFFQMGDASQLVKELRSAGYAWVRVTYQSVIQKIRLRARNITGRVYRHNGIWVFENHFTGFDEQVISHIRNTEFPTYTVSAHPLMLSLKDKTESKENFQRFLDAVAVQPNSVEFVTPGSVLRSGHSFQSESGERKAQELGEIVDI